MFLKSLFGVVPKRWKTNIGGKATTNGRNSIGKRLGLKVGVGILLILST